ncbi:MAG: tRNA pseudouridine(55) synthase TruB, partial [Acidimicrobiia bacterium]
MTTIEDGFLLVDKPQGWTSHDVVAKTRGTIGVRKVGHAGTLDPMATGLLVLGVGRATRLLRFVQEAPKEYVARAMFGVATDTLDADGAVLSREPLPVAAADVDSVMDRFVGPQMQVPPMVSARKVGGKRLYELAREGIEVAREPRPVVIHALEMIDFAPSDYPEVEFRVRCSSGTYVRTLADDLAASLGGRAHLTALRRTCIGSLAVDRACALDQIESAAGDGGWQHLLLAPRDGLVDLPSIALPADLVQAVSNGLRFPVGALGSD